MCYIEYIFYCSFFSLSPFLCFIPALIIISKTTKTETMKGIKNLMSCFFNFYKILFIENPVTISGGCILMILVIGLSVFPLIDSPQEKEIKIWQIGLELTRVLTPIILLVTPFAVAIRNFERLFVSDFQRKLCHIISTMRRHKIVLGYGYLGREVFSELKERRIVTDKNVFEVITPTLKKRRIYKDLLIVDKDCKVFNNVFSDPVYGDIGIIEPEIVQSLDKQPNREEEKSDIYDAPLQQKNKEPEEPVLIAGIIGDVNKTTLERSNVNEAMLFISAIPDYDATNKAIEIMSEKKCSCIITIQDLYQLKLQLPSIYDKTKNSEPMILLYPSYMEGITLGRSVFFAAKRWQTMKTENQEKLPRIIICGSGKQIYYLTEAYLLGLQQISGMNLFSNGLDIWILSDEEFYIKKANKNVQHFKDIGIEGGTLDEIVESPNGTSVKVTWQVLFSEPWDKKNIRKILEKSKPDIIVVSHKKAWNAIKILRSWSDIICSIGGDYKPTILVGTKTDSGEEKEKVIKYLKKYAKQRNIQETSFPIQTYDASVEIYADAREQIGSIAEALTYKNRKKHKKAT